MVSVIASLKSKKGKESELEEVLKSLFPNVQKEEGTLVYILNKALDEDGRYTFYEKFKDRDAFDFHNSSAYFQSVLGKVKFLLNEEPNIVVYEEVAAISK